MKRTAAVDKFAHELVCEAIQQLHAQRFRLLDVEVGGNTRTTVAVSQFVFIGVELAQVELRGHVCAVCECMLVGVGEQLVGNEPQWNRRIDVESYAFGVQL